MKLHYDRGTYKVRVTGQGFSRAQTGTPQFSIRFVVLERVEPFNDGLDQLERTIYMALTPNTIERVKEDLRALGFTGDSIEDLDPSQEGHHDFTGKEFEFFCVHGPDQNGQLRERWSVREVERPLDRDKLKELNRLFSKPKTASMKPKATAPAASSSDYITEDDTPPLDEDQPKFGKTKGAA
jgi:hypothetical protein